jgi:N-acetylneuraminate synthase
MSTRTTPVIQHNVFHELFVLEMANNHWGNVERGLAIINEFTQVARFNNVRATIKLQFRDVDSFVHRDFKSRTDIRYVKKTIDTRLSKKDYATLVETVRDQGCLTSGSRFPSPPAVPR